MPGTVIVGWPRDRHLPGNWLRSHTATSREIASVGSNLIIVLLESTTSSGLRMGYRYTGRWSRCSSESERETILTAQCPDTAVADRPCEVVKRKSF